MGKPKGHGARLKFHASSSSQAASLLHSGTSTLGFGGYIGSRRIESSLSSEDTDLPTDIDSDLALHLRRLGKKDPTTKLKSLDSLSMLLKQKSGNDVIPIIPQWVFEYKRLLLDYSREVRRATHDTMTNLVIAVGRDLAPHLKSLMGPWWFAQFDPVAELSLAAKKSLQAAFPLPEKRLDALMLYVYEIFVYFEDNLKLTLNTMTDKRAASDEIEEIYQHVISSSLFALATCLDIVCMHGERSDFRNVMSVPKHAFNSKDTAICFTEKLLAAHKYFLGFLESQSARIRLATHSVLRSYIENVPSAFKDSNIRKIAIAVFGTLKEKDRSCHSSMWDTITLFSKRYPETWTDSNVQKPALNKFFSFIRNGFHGSPLSSYKKLLPFLESLPQILVTEGKFISEFFESLWGGRYSSSILNDEIPAFFVLFKQCFIWALCSVSRYFNGINVAHQFQVMLVTNILLGILWEDFLTCANNSEGGLKSSLSKASDELPENAEPLQEQILKTKASKYSYAYSESLGKCIVDVLSTISSLDGDLLSIFCIRFEEDCMNIVQQISSRKGVSEDAERVIMLLLLVDQHSVKEGQVWPFERLVGPMLSKTFPFIKSHATVEAVNILSMAVSMFGSRKIVEKMYPVHERDPQHHCGKISNEKFLLIFKDVFIPWCLCEYKSSTGSAQLDLLFQLIEEDCFTEQWDMIITYARNMESLEFGSSSLDFVDLLAFILEKAMEEQWSKVAENSSEFHKGFISKKWHHSHIDTTAIIIINSSCVKDSHTRFMRAVMGGLTKDSKSSFLSRNVVISIFKAVFDVMVSFISRSPFSSFRESVSVLCGEDNSSFVKYGASETTSKMGSFVSETLSGCRFLLKLFEEDDGLLLGVFTALFLTEWEHSVLCLACGGETIGDADSRFSVSESMHSVHNKITKKLFKSIDLSFREKIGGLLFRFIWSIICKEEKISVDMASLCSLWTLEILEILCENQHEEQKFLDMFLSSCSSWPLRTVLNFRNGKLVAAIKCEDFTDVDANAACNIGVMIDMLISKLGFDRVVLGIITSPSIEAELEIGMILPESGYPRAWLAAEMLCLWNWNVGCITDSLLPSIIRYSERVKFSKNDPFLFFLVELLVDGALLQNEPIGQIASLDIWSTSHHDLVNIEGCFHRALFSLLLGLFRDGNAWKSDEACILFEFLLSKLYMGEDVNINSLKLFPPVMSILVQPLCCKRDETDKIIIGSLSDSFQGTLMHDSVLKWLSKVAEFPPLSSWKQELDNMAEWYHLVLSYYPLRYSGKKVILGREITPSERKLLLQLFHKEKSQAAASPATLPGIPHIQTLLPKLLSVTVAYCGREFGEEDWEFVFLNTRIWIEKSVVLMEEIAENAASTLPTSPPQNLEVTVASFDQSIAVSRYALDIFSVVCDIIVCQRMERWESFRDRVHESVLRIFLCSGAVESPEFCISSRTAPCDHRWFWESVSSVSVVSTVRARDRAMKAFRLWGLKRGPVGSLYATLFSSGPASPPLQVAAFVILATEPVVHAAVIKDSVLLTGSSEGDNMGSVMGEMVCHLRGELTSAIGELPSGASDLDFSVSKEELNFLLALSLLLSIISSLSSGAIKQKLIDYVQEEVDLGFLDFVIRHIPLEFCTAHNLRKKDGGIPSGLKGAAEGATAAIESGSLLSAVESLWPIENHKLSAFCGAIYGLTLCVLPAYVRNWFNGLRDQSVSLAVENFTKSWCSPSLIADEFLKIKKGRRVEGSMSISMSKTGSEVVGTYTKEETRMEMVMRLPGSYPLRTVEVECRKGVGISEGKRRKWFMLMTSFLRNKNGALAEALEIWKRNLDREFQGIEECPICYTIIHAAAASSAAMDAVPRLACKTCKHKFHSACLYKWFSTSHKSTCPLCLSPF